MKITIVHGFFLPVPPAAGGAMEKAWWSLARIFAARGHEVVSLSRTWPTWPSEERVDGVYCNRLPGYDHTASLRRNLLRDARWGLRLLPRLPRADILVTNTVFLPVLAPWIRPSAGRLVINLNRLPKGQLRTYFRVARLQVPSSAVAAAVKNQCPRLVPSTRIFANPIDHGLFSSSPRDRLSSPVHIGYIGRIHPEKGIDLLVSAATRLLADTTLPPWKLVLRGPVDIPQGGGGEVYLGKIRHDANALISSGRLEILPPEFDPATLAAHYGELDIFTYPSQAEKGETFGVAIAEAMSAGAVPIVSDLPCFRDLVTDGENGLVFSRHAPDATARLAQAMAELIRDTPRRHKQAAMAAQRSASFSAEVIADAMLADFSQLLETK